MRLSYEQCRELKKAGFPQEKSEHYYIDQNESTGAVSDYDESFHNDKRNCDCPSLSELIEECWEGFGCLEKENEPYIEEQRWMAYSSDYTAYDGINAEIETEGKTPEEAVYKLYLALKKK